MLLRGQRFSVRRKVVSTRQRASERIIDTVTAWPGVVAGPGRRGELAFTVGKREIGHLHGDNAAHFAFPKSVWVDLKQQGRIEDHPVFPGRQGLGARRIESESDVDDVIALLRINYERVLAREREHVDAAA
jgi:Luciferase